VQITVTAKRTCLACVLQDALIKMIELSDGELATVTGGVLPVVTRARLPLVGAGRVTEGSKLLVDETRGNRPTTAFLARALDEADAEAAPAQDGYRCGFAKTRAAAPLNRPLQQPLGPLACSDIIG
jgi:hypothetical protein